MFFLFFGTKETEAQRGVVVDLCPACRRVQPFSVVDHRRTMHLYFVPLGKGRYQGSTRQCVECGRHFKLDPRRYSEVLSQEEAERLDLEEGLRRTTPSLAERFDAIDSIARAAHGSAYRGAIDESDEERLREAADRLRELELRGVDSSRFVRRFADYGSLDASSRRSLLAELEGYVAGLGAAR